MVTRKVLYVKLAKTCLVVAVAAGATFAANAADANGVKLKVTGVAVVDDTYEGKSGAKFLPPETRVVVPSEKQLALFRVQYDVPTNMNVRIFLEQNGDPKGFSCNFGTSGSALYSGAGVGARILHLDGKNYREDGDLYDDGVLVKSVRLSCYGEDDECGFYVCDAPVNVLFAKDGEKKTDGFKVLEPLPPPPAKSLSLLPGWAEDFKAACAQAKKDGKLVLAYFLNSRPGDEGKAMKVLDHEVLGSEEFLKRAGASYVCYMVELYKPSQSWMAKDNIRFAVNYAVRKGVFSPPEIAIIHPDGSRVALLDREGWEGGVDGYLAKIEKGCKAALLKREAEEKARKAAAKKVPPKTDATSTPAGFTDNLDEALAKAKAEGKLVYACFSGSDWCYWCKKLEKEVLSNPLFVAGVMDDYVLVFIDSPENKALLSDRAKAENEKLTKKYGIRGFPTAFILDGDGNRIGKTGYRQGGAVEYVKHLKSIKAGDFRLDGKCGEKPRNARPARKAKAGVCGTSPKSAETMRRMKVIVLPEVKFGPQTTLADAIGSLRDASIDHDSPNIPKDERGFSIILMMGNDGVPALPEIKLKNVRFHEALKTVCEAVRYQFTVNENGTVIVKPDDETKE